MSLLRVRALLVAVAVLAAVLAAPPGPASAVVSVTPVEVSQGWVPGSEVLFSQFSPDSSHLVYRADSATDEVVELWSVASSGGTPVRLNQPLVAGGDVLSFRISPDSGRVVFTADATVDGVTELFSVPIGGGVPTTLNSPMVSGGDVRAMQITPNSARVLYTADQQTDEAVDLYQVPIGGGSPVRLNTPVQAGGVVDSSFTVTPDSTRAVYVRRANAADQRRLQSVPVTGGVEVQLSAEPAVPVSAGSGVSRFRVAPDGARVLYSAEQDTDDLIEMYSVAPTGGAVASLSGAPMPRASVGVFEILSDSSRVLFLRAEAEGNRLWSAPVAGGSGPVDLTGTMVPGGDVGIDIAWTPDSSRVLFIADRLVDERHDLFAVPPTGGTPIRLTTGVADGASVGFRDISPDLGAASSEPARVVFMGTAGATTRLYSVVVAGGDPVALSPTMVPGGNVTGFIASPDGRWVLYTADQDVDGVIEAYLVSSSGGEVTKLNPPVAAGGGLASYAMARDSRHAMFTGQVEVVGTGDVYLVDLPAPPSSAARFVPVAPTRLFDTRPGEPGAGPKGLVPAGGQIDVQVAGVGPVPSSASAVVLNVTATDAQAAGFVTVWPAGQSRPLASSLNLTAPGQTRPNSVTVPVGQDGRVSLYTQAGAHLLADVTGYFEPVPGPVSAGRILPVPPTRVFDTRVAEAPPGPKGVVPAGGQIDVQVAGVGPVPSSASAVVLNVTATEAVGAGFVTVWPAGQPQPLASTLNLNGPGDTAPNLVIMPVGAGGRISFFSQAGTHLLADVTGWVTDAAQPADDAGLFVPLPPTRLFDTRPDEPAPGPKGFVAAGATIITHAGGVATIPEGAGLVFLNVTATQAETGFVTTYPTGQPQPLASTLNLVGPVDTRANAAVMPLGAGGQLSHAVQSGAHLLADTTGYTLP